MARQIRRVNAAVLTELAQHRREEAARSAAVMQTDERCTFIETAPRGVRCPQVHLARTTLGVRATHMNDSGLRQRQTATISGVDHYCSSRVALHPLSRVERRARRAADVIRTMKAAHIYNRGGVYGAMLAKKWMHFSGSASTHWWVG